MLTMGKPIAIACSREICTMPDMLSEKIISNYQMMWLQAAPEEFLHLVTAAQVYGEAAEKTQLAIYHLTDHNQIYIQILKQFLNRVLCYGSSQFTYADQVYMGIVLRKLELNASFFWRWFQKWQNQEYSNDSPYYLYKHIYQKLHTAQITEQIKQLNYRDYYVNEVSQGKEVERKYLDSYNQREIQYRDQGEDEDIESGNRNLIAGLKKGSVSGYQAQKIFYELEKLQREHHFAQISMAQWQKIQKERAEQSEVLETLRAREREQSRILLRDEKRQRFPQELREPETEEQGILLRGEEQRELSEKFRQQETEEEKSVLLRDGNLQDVTGEIKEQGRKEQKIILRDVNLQGYTEEIKRQKREKEKVLLGGEEQRELSEKFKQQETEEEKSVLLRDRNLQEITEELKHQKRKEEKEKIVLRQRAEQEEQKVLWRQQQDCPNLFLKQRGLLKVQETLELKKDQRTLAAYEEIQELSQGQKKQEKQKDEKIVLRQIEKVQETLEEPDRQPEQRKNAEPFGESEKYQQKEWRRQPESERLFLSQIEEAGSPLRLGEQQEPSQKSEDQEKEDQRNLALYGELQEVSQELSKKEKQKDEKIRLRQIEEVQELLIASNQQPKQRKDAEPFGKREKYQQKQREWRRQPESERLFLSQIEEAGGPLRLGEQQEPSQKSEEQEKEEQRNLALYGELQELSQELKKQEKQKYQQKQREWRKQSESERLFLSQIEEAGSPLRLGEQQELSQKSVEQEKEDQRNLTLYGELQEVSQELSKQEKQKDEKIRLRQIEEIQELLIASNQQPKQRKDAEPFGKREKYQQKQEEWRKQQEIQIEGWKTFLKPAQKRKPKQESRERQQLELIHKNSKFAEALVLDDRQKEALEVREIKKTAEHLQKEQILVRQSSQQTQEILQQETNQRFVRQQQEALQREADRLQQLLMQNLHNQVNQITDKVYGKLERRLQNERRRRGW